MECTGIRPTRREVVHGAAVGTAALAATSALAPAVRSAPVPVVDDVRHLVTRATWGFNEREYLYAQSIGYSQWLEEQLAPSASLDIAYQAFENASFPALAMSPRDLVLFYPPGTFSRAEYAMSRVTSAVWSRCQLRDRMVQFWLDLLNINIFDPSQWHLLIPWYQNVIRPRALDTFPNLLKASIQGPAMLAYLNNDQNVASGPNENYAREIMELHAMGTKWGGFDEADVKSLARLFTGLTWEQDFDATDPVTGAYTYGTFKFDSGVHDFNQVDLWTGTNWAESYANNGLVDAIDAADKMAKSPPAALHIAEKLVESFLREDVSSQAVFSSLVVPVAIEYDRTEGDVKSVLRKLFDPALIPNTDPENLPRFKEPLRYTAGAARGLDIPLPEDPFPPSFGAPPEYGFAAFYLNALGDVPQTTPSPDGPPEGSFRWADGTRDRILFANDLCDDQIAGFDFGLGELSDVFGNVALSQLASRANDFLTGGTLDPADVAAAQAFVASRGYTVAAIRRMVALLVSSAGYQRMKG